MLAPLLRLAPDPGICSLPSLDWPLPREHARSPPWIGPCPENMLAPLLGLAPDPGICSLPSLDWPAGARGDEVEPEEDPSEHEGGGASVFGGVREGQALGAAGRARGGPD
eukprot:74231-Prorocentrum_minimum.AAC.1